MERPKAEAVQRSGGFPTTLLLWYLLKQILFSGFPHIVGLTIFFRELPTMLDFSLCIFLRPWIFPISFDLPVPLITVVLNLIKFIPVGNAYIYAVMRCYKVRDNFGKNCVHLRNNPLRWDAIKLATRATVFTRHL